MRVLLIELVMNECNAIPRIVEDPSPEDLKIMLACTGQFGAVDEEVGELAALYRLTNERGWVPVVGWTKYLADRGPFEHVVVYGGYY